MKPLPKHLRTRWRYIGVAIETWPSVTVDRSTFDKAITAAARTLLGDTGVASIDISLYTFRYTTGYGEAIIRTPRDAVEQTRAALACLSTIDSAPVRIDVLGISGTVRACEEKYLGREPEEPPERTVVFEGAERTAVCRDKTVDIRVGEAFVGATGFDIQ